jgi:hypothetical protein
MHLLDNRKNGRIGVAEGAIVALCALSSIVGPAALVRADTSVPSESVFVEVSWSGWQIRRSEPSQVVPRELRDWTMRFKALAEAKLIGAQ